MRRARLKYLRIVGNGNRWLRWTQAGKQVIARLAKLRSARIRWKHRREEESRKPAPSETGAGPGGLGCSTPAAARIEPNLLSGILSIMIRDCAPRRCASQWGIAPILRRRRFVVSTPAATHLLWTALERNADWIAAYISISRSAVVEDYLKWFFERLKDRVPREASDRDLDHLVRAEVKSVYGEFRDRPSGLPLGDYADTSAHKFGFCCK